MSESTSVIDDEEALFMWCDRASEADGIHAHGGGLVPEPSLVTTALTATNGRPPAPSFPPSAVHFVVRFVHGETGKFLQAPSAPAASSSSSALLRASPAAAASAPSVMPPPDSPSATQGAVSYEESFPPLSMGLAPPPATALPQHLISRKKKKRIRSTLVTPSTATAHDGNIARLPSSDDHMAVSRAATTSTSSGELRESAAPPASPPRNGISYGLTTPPKSEDGSKEERGLVQPQLQEQPQPSFEGSSRLAAILSPTVASTSALSHLGSPTGKSQQRRPMLSPSHSESQSPTSNGGRSGFSSISSPRVDTRESLKELLRAHTTPTTNDATSVHVRSLRMLARLYGSFILDQLVDRAAEIVYLFRLLRCPLHSADSVQAINFASETRHRFFEAGTDCVAFAVYALAATVPLMQHLDVGILNLVVEDPVMCTLVSASILYCTPFVPPSRSLHPPN